MFLARRFQRSISFQTSAQAEAALDLLRVQPYIDEAFIDRDYRLEHAMYGCQPYRMSEPPGFEAVFHLGFRQDLLGASILQQPLIATFFTLLEKAYGLDPPPYDGAPYLTVPDEPPGEHVVFQGFGQSLMDHLPAEARTRLADFWRRLLAGIGREVVIVTAEADRDFYRDFDGRLVCPRGLLETARLIRSAKCFLGVQSAAAAVADGLKAPRIVFHWFRNADPSGPNGLTFALDASPDELLAAARARLGI